MQMATEGGKVGRMEGYEGGGGVVRLIWERGRTAKLEDQSRFMPCSGLVDWTIMDC
ncbi:hypothetical protein BofuT4_uP096780.1 [Botrytis cinerea T4]|uniref:Uncharacterized protein n=1 Tax=Botryotinia fuckeliana (strain T4) TaxID=999810 RepID=G2YCS2_BOTF4|nr:hypothetical protein BofuT4_uP096780.1 [Botrytis cinerea T4]